MTERVTRFHSDHVHLRARFGRTARLSLDLGVPCPHRERHPPGCLFCRPGVILPDRIRETEDLGRQIETGIQVLSRRYQTDRFLAYFQNETSTFGERSVLLSAYDRALAHPKVVGLVLSTRPDYLEAGLLEDLAERATRKPVFLELGLQSANDATLRRINRGHRFADFVRALERADSNGLPVGAHLVLGLPGETREEMLGTFDALASLPLGSVKIHHLQIYSGAPIEAAWRKGKVSLFDTFESYLPLLADALERLPWRIRVQRLVADAPGRFLLAPRWNRAKNEIISAVEGELLRRGTWQGFRRGEPFPGDP